MWYFDSGAHIDPQEGQVMLFFDPKRNDNPQNHLDTGLYTKTDSAGR